MIDPRPPLRALLRDPAQPVRVEALWTRIAARRGAVSGRSASGSGWGWLAHSTPRLRGSVLALACAVLAASIWHGTASREPRGQIAMKVSPAAPEALRLRDGQPFVAFEAPTDQPHAIELSDGTRIAIAAGSRVSPRVSRPDEFELTLEHGRASFDVRPQGARRFAVIAGDVSIEVVGTSFTVERTPQTVRVAVEHGRVRVRLTGVPGGESWLGAGESLDWPPTRRAAVETETSPEPLSSSSASGPVTTPAPRPSAWELAAKQGDYAGAYALLGPDGYARAVEDARGAGQLLVLADMARSVSESSYAAWALERLVSKHPRDRRAALAALTLGKLQLDALGRPDAACRTFQGALELSLPVALHEDALARLIEACARAGNTGVARRAAAEYRERFPEGRWRMRIDGWLGAP